MNSLAVSIIVFGILIFILFRKVEKLEEDNDTLHYTVYGLDKKRTEKNPKGGIIDRVEELEEAHNIDKDEEILGKSGSKTRVSGKRGHP